MSAEKSEWPSHEWMAYGFDQVSYLNKEEEASEQAPLLNSCHCLLLRSLSEVTASSKREVTAVVTSATGVDGLRDKKYQTVSPIKVRNNQRVNISRKH